ncbi:hypothetical protein PR202_ga01497 [Eleusine coracana subsp. coracana]|uniref:Uncharacterized protein n=1 Tax=Eleusine coracana subsp. coracana TaxID=191504 RepID=A0AAV5BF39_ELECO|nr:hypothetical protein PR202_ga00810 [Eleusine coracana subsp. coracana]GJM85706.1 hypothetical protein PR202_ga01497 [Eleusine coracana subsp. coracana]
MMDWGPLVVAVALFIVLSSGLLFPQISTRTRLVELGNMCTSGISVLVHAAIFFAVLALLDVFFPVHVRTGY